MAKTLIDVGPGTARRSAFTPLRGMVVLCVLSVLVLIIALEIGARVAVYLSYGKQDHGFHHVFTYEPYLGTRTNERFRAAYPAKGDAFRVLVLGGSVANHLAAVPEHVVRDIFAQVTPRRLEVLNFAQSGHTAAQEAIMLAIYGLRVEPDLIVAVDGANDLVAMTK
jgi:hypothetical protein